MYILKSLKVMARLSWESYKTGLDLPNSAELMRRMFEVLFQQCCGQLPQLFSMRLCRIGTSVVIPKNEKKKNCF